MQGRLGTALLPVVYARVKRILGHLCHPPNTQGSVAHSELLVLAPWRDYYSFHHLLGDVLGARRLSAFRSRRARGEIVQVASEIVAGPPAPGPPVVKLRAGEGESKLN